MGEWSGSASLAWLKEGKKKRASFLFPSLSLSLYSPPLWPVRAHPSRTSLDARWTTCTLEAHARRWSHHHDRVLPPPASPAQDRPLQGQAARIECSFLCELGAPARLSCCGGSVVRCPSPLLIICRRSAKQRLKKFLFCSPEFFSFTFSLLFGPLCFDLFLLVSWSSPCLFQSLSLRLSPGLLVFWSSFSFPGLSPWPLLCSLLLVFPSRPFTLRMRRYLRAAVVGEVKLT